MFGLIIKWVGGVGKLYSTIYSVFVLLPCICQLLCFVLFSFLFAPIFKLGAAIWTSIIFVHKEKEWFSIYKSLKIQIDSYFWYWYRLLLSRFVWMWLLLLLLHIARNKHLQSFPLILAWKLHQKLCTQHIHTNNNKYKHSLQILIKKKMQHYF